MNKGNKKQVLVESPKDASEVLRALEKIIRNLNPNLSMDEIQLRALAAVRDSFDCEAGAIAMVDDSSKNGVLIKKTLGSGTEWIYQAIVQPGEGLIGECYSKGESIVNNQPRKDPQYKESIDSAPDMEMKSFLGVPLVADGKIVGVVSVQNKKNADFSEYDQVMLESMANTIASLLFYLNSIKHLRVMNAHLEASRWELIRSRNTLRSLFDNLPDSLYIIDQNYQLVAINMSRALRADREPRQLVGALCYEALYKRNEPCPGCLVGETFFEKRNTHRTGRQWDEGNDPMEWEISTYPIIDESDHVIQVILFEQDVTEKHRLETSLAQSEKMAAVGQLAAGIAHEINNPLTVVLANAQILQRELPEDHEAQESVDLIYRAGSRALHVVRNLLNFARKEQYEFIPTDINSTIERALEMLKHELLERSIELTYDPADNLPLVMASADHLQGVWLNILLNAMDATEKEKGRLKVATMQQGNEVRITISDNGQGISQDALKRIFEPFFTTKEPGRGTGLGLSLCHRIVKQHGGHILVDSMPGKGTTFTVVLPVF